MKPNKVQKAFLQQHGVAESECFDATGLSLREYGPVMKERGYKAAIGVTPCKAANHVLRDRKGRCLMCYPENFAYLSRHYSSGVVYLAFSPASSLVKVGTTKELNGGDGRRSTLNKQSYAGQKDWEIVASVQTDNSGEIEMKIQTALSDYKLPVNYLRGAQQVEANEIFQCSLSKAKSIFKKLTTSA